MTRRLARSAAPAKLTVLRQEPGVVEFLTGGGESWKVRLTPTGYFALRRAPHPSPRAYRVTQAGCDCGREIGQARACDHQLAVLAARTLGLEAAPTRKRR